MALAPLSPRDTSSPQLDLRNSNTPSRRFALSAEHRIHTINSDPRAEGRTTERQRPFLIDIKEIRRRARAHIDRGAVTESYRADQDTVVRLLNEALATEIVCVLRYKRHYYTATGIHAQGVAQEFLE